MEFHEVLRQRRTALGLSQADLATAAGVDTRQIKRYEAAQAQPLLPVAQALANALGISLSELAGLPTPRVDISGRWWSTWQTAKGGTEMITTQELNLHQDRDIVQVHALSRGLAVADGGYLWSGELKMWDQEILMGWYAAADGATRSKGTMYFVLHPHGQQMTGRWVGLSYDSNLETGWAALARTKTEARQVLDALRDPTATVG
jgi:transcriptional regulator with XRE-family HTH domain